MLKYVPALVLLLAAGPVLAQAGATQTPPAPNAGSAAPVPPNSVPAGAENINPGSPANPNVAGPVGVTTVSPGAAGTTGTAGTMPGGSPAANTAPAVK